MGVLTADHLTGLGMAGDTVIAGRTLPGGIVYRDLEVLNIMLGSGNDTFTILSTHEGATNIYGGAGNDEFHVQAIAGHTTIDAGAGDDVFLIGSQAAPNLSVSPANQLETINALLTLIGGAGSDALYVDDSAESAAGIAKLTGSVLTGLGMPSISEIQTIFVQAATGVYTLRIADKTIDSHTATTTLLELSGTPIANDKWSIIVDGTKRAEFVVTSAALTVSDIAAALAAFINSHNASPLTESDEFTGFTAIADGAMVAIVNASGTGFQAAFEIVTSATAPTVTVSDVLNASATMTLSGQLNAGDTWNFNVSGRSYAIPAGASLATMASTLAAAINADAALPNYLAVAIGDTVVVVDRAANPGRATFVLSIALAGGAGTGSSITPASTVALALAGTPLVGERWYLTLGGTDYGVNVAAGMSLADVTAGLAAVLTTGTRAAAAEGTTLLIADRTGVAFPADLVVRVQASGSAGSRSASTQTTAFVLSGTPKSGDRWLVTINGTTQVVTVGGATDTLAEIAQALAEAIDADAGASFTVFHAGSTLYVTERNGAASPQMRSSRWRRQRAAAFLRR